MSETNRKSYPLLSKIDSPYDLRKLHINQLGQLVNEIRIFLIETLNVSGGHFASNLGVLELTVALHYVYNTPKDHLVWDVGHQAYIHKILTGRADELITIKKSGGISGFPKRSESVYDSFGVGHSSTSISAALGMAEANSLKLSTSKSIAIIGDGGLTAGMAFEALNHAGGICSNLLVILNDNKMSISRNVGALSLDIARKISSLNYNSAHESDKDLPKKLKLTNYLEIEKEERIFAQKDLFKALNFCYFGPINGHNINTLIQTLRALKQHRGPNILHILTKKGKGFRGAENDPIKFHHVNPRFNSKSSNKILPKKLSYSHIFGQWICDMAEKDKKLVAVTPAMCEGSSLIKFSKEYPERYYDVAIAEQHAITFSAGLACRGYKPVIAIYSTFLQRAYDQVIHDVSLQNLNVLYAVDRAGIVGADGPTHSGIFDLSFMRCIPNTLIMTPSDENECYHMLSLGFEYEGPAIVRYPKDIGTGAKITQNLDLKVGQSRCIIKGKKIVILNFGALLPIAVEVAEKFNATVIDMRFVKPLDTSIIEDVVKSHNIIVTLEENVVIGGAGSGVNEYLVMNDLSCKIKVRNIGLPDCYQNHGGRADLLAEVGISAEGLSKFLRSIV